MSSDFLSLQHPALARLDQWINERWMRPLDRALAAMLIDDGNEQDERVLLLAALASQQLGQGDICVDLQRAVATPAQLFSHPPRSDSSESPLHWLKQQTLADLLDALQHSAVVASSEQEHPSAPLIIDNHRLYLRRYFRYETDVAGQISARLAYPLTPPAQLKHRLDTLFPPRQDGQPDWQKIACALASRSAFTLITGGPGTGKTTTVVRLLGLLQSVAMEQGAPLRIRLAAPTGKAAARLKSSISSAIASLPLDASVRDKIPAEVSTLHKLLGSRPDSRSFRHHRHNPLHADLVVVDEASMMDLDITASLLDALRPDTRLILIGDKDQLSSVEAGAVLGNLCLGADGGQYTSDTVNWLQQNCGEDVSVYAGNGSALAQQTAMLRVSHRFSADSGIGELARAVNCGQPDQLTAVWQKNHHDIEQRTLGSLQDHNLTRLAVDGYSHYLKVLEEKRPATDSGIENWATEVLTAFDDFQLLCALREGDAGVAGLNQRIARELYRSGLIGRAEGWYEGRPVIMTRNDYQLGLMNGDVGVTLNLASAEQPVMLRVAFRLADGHISLVLPSRLEGVDSVYAMTVHKSQGSEFRHAALVLPDNHQGVSRELLYTAITRARQHFTVLGTAAALTLPARPTVRASGLAARLHG
ncbi:exodeoxyribonuclease V subunit alpha [Alcanivorax sp. 1008]|uniref:exodeoxyribonuclease V subunit alpha n=1 Tax=Alcanivorax sp. 1008 TaxID=2816853 RepID=UPI001D1C3B35|nr:exodeoxyribonuclease V subunit alpha [Alcanivorax sp. 1008]MCC1497197.1 exodeoxyribonuclease V subunit alpha [Alcanivorax sp. 1008]